MESEMFILRWLWSDVSYAMMCLIKCYNVLANVTLVLVKLSWCGLEHRFSWESLKVGTLGLCSVFQKLLRTDPLEMCLYMRTVNWEVAVIRHASLAQSVKAVISAVSTRHSNCMKKAASPSVSHIVCLLYEKIIHISQFRYKSSTLEPCLRGR